MILIEQKGGFQNIKRSQVNSRYECFLVTLIVVFLASCSQQITLHQAIRKNDIDTVHQLINADAKLEMTDKAGLTPLSLAAKLGYLSIVKLLLESGADIHHPAIRGNKQRFMGTRPAIIFC